VGCSGSPPREAPPLSCNPFGAATTRIEKEKLVTVGESGDSVNLRQGRVSTCGAAFSGCASLEAGAVAVFIGVALIKSPGKRLNGFPSIFSGLFLAPLLQLRSATVRLAPFGNPSRTQYTYSEFPNNSVGTGKKSSTKRNDDCWCMCTLR
jgi:hypothetical protein